ncbi:MAG: TIM barrel protein [Armatimonadetes bacterium]|nr:TIM barrel protein [Armatimonadota bacterium]
MATPSVCIEKLLTEFPFLERINQAAKLGYPAVEFWFAGQNNDNKAAEEKAFGDIANACAKVGVSVAAFVINSPDGSIGGSLINPEERGVYLKRLERVVELANIVNCRMIITCAGNCQPGKSKEEQVQSIIDALKEAAPIAENGGITLLLEPLNSLVNHPGYFLDSSAIGAEIVKAVGSPNVKLLYDIYHMQIMEGNIISTIRKYIDIIGHFHSAGVPGRHELTSGELNYHDIIAEIDSLGYTGYFGLEYSPLLESVQSLGLLRESLMLW